MTGRLFLIVGNSGSGKDSIIKGVKELMPDVRVVKRFITRQPGEHEDNHYVTREQFNSLLEQGQFFLNWQSYDHHYGVSGEVIDWLESGHDVLVNVSRSVIPLARSLYPNTKVVFVKVPIEQVINRIKSRGREDESGIKKRIERAFENKGHDYADYVVDNSGELSEAVNELIIKIKKKE